MKKSFLKLIVCSIIVFSLLISLGVSVYAQEAYVTDTRTETWWHDGLHEIWTMTDSSITGKWLIYDVGYEVSHIQQISSTRTYYDPESGDEEWEYVFKYYYNVW